MITNEDIRTSSRVNHPSYYGLPCGIEVIDIARHMDFNLGNVLKYVLRAGNKYEQGMTRSEKRVEDLEKALFYLQDEIRMYYQNDNNDND